ncbi:MAG: hypothetical protein LBS89_00655, partial [Zoogloeaceae bacterium]|nr:hypothetical protein [Zoogloeaceae bacterium]
NLFECPPEILRTLEGMEKILIDPPREGALDIVKSLPEQGGPQRLVYISCNPATLARDAAILVSQKHYRLRSAGAINMFPHTAHVESIAVFEHGSSAIPAIHGGVSETKRVGKPEASPEPYRGIPGLQAGGTQKD